MSIEMKIRMSTFELKTHNPESLLVLQSTHSWNFYFDSKQYLYCKGAVIKNTMRVNCCSENWGYLFQLTNKSVYKKFPLKATINHSWTLQADYYWAHKKDEDNSGWLKCHDTSVIATPFSGLSNASSYVFVLVAT